jgi:hypothetical protein
MISYQSRELLATVGNFFSAHHANAYLDCIALASFTHTHAGTPLPVLADFDPRARLIAIKEMDCIALASFTHTRRPSPWPPTGRRFFSQSWFLLLTPL